MIIINKETAQMRIFLDFTNLLGDAVVWSRGGLFLDLSLLCKRRKTSKVKWGWQKSFTAAATRACMRSRWLSGITRITTAFRPLCW